MAVTTYSPAPGIDVLTSATAVPGLGMLPINAFVVHGPEPVLVDTGAIIERDEFLEALRSVIDPTEIRWIWLTHTDFDHIGALHELLAQNDRLKVVTSFVGVGIMGLYAPLPLDRVHLINPGQSLTIGDRTLTALKPPTWDNPITTGFYDDRTRALFSSDCFGAMLSEVPTSAADLSDDELRQGQVLWATVDSPWVLSVAPELFAQRLDAIAAIDPAIVLSSHLPAAPGQMTERLLASLAAVSSADPFVQPDQAALELLLAQMTGATPAPAPN